MQVIKRDMRVKKYEEARIFEAIKSAYADVYNNPLSADVMDDIYDITLRVNKDIEDTQKEKVTVEEIQDIVVKNIKQYDETVAKAYQRYREERSRERERKFYSFYKENVIDKISEENSNANVDENNFGGKEMRISDDILEHNTDILIKEKLGEKIYNDTKTCIKIHDKSKFTLGQHNCLLMPYKDMIFKNGINTRQGDTKPTKTYNTACHLVPVAIQSQSLDMFGGCGLMNFSIYMVESLKWSITYFTNLVISISNYPIEEIKMPLRFKEAKQILNEELFDKMMTLMRKDTENANQALITNLITLQSRSGHQLPFSSINLGLIDPDNEEESAYIVEMFLKEIDKGVGKRDRTAVFPITIFQVKGGVNRYPQDKYYYLRMLAQEVSHRRLYPTFVNCDFSHNVVTGWESEMNMMGKQLLLM